MAYNDAVDYINSFINFEKIPKYKYASSFKLERMHAFLKELGNPHQGLKVLHVAGSKGKGSTCAISAYILKEAGYKVGLYTSPHLVDFRERIRVLSKQPATSNQLPEIFEGMIGEDEFAGLIEKVKPAAEKFRDHKTFGEISFFEVVTAAAFLYFKDKKVDFAVLETGLGGRLDATNVTMPLACGITNISLEHTDKLGDTLEKIALEKVGIIKAGVPVVSAAQEKEVRDVIRRACKERGVKLHEVGKDIKYSITTSNEERQVFNIEGPGYSYNDLELNLIGQHQAENASLSIGMLKAAGGRGLNIGEAAVREGLKKATWPGRLQIVKKDPYVILDGAQNPASIKALISSVKSLFGYEKLISVFGISSDKDIKGVSRLLDDASDIIILTKAKDNPRAKEPSGLKDYFRRTERDLLMSDNIDAALEKALAAADRDDLILVTGSLFVVGDALRYLSNENNKVEIEVKAL